MSIWDVFKSIEGKKTSVFGKPEYIVAGLGNFGLQFENTRHNAGFMAADFIARENGFDFNRQKFKAKTGETVISGKSCLFLKPTTFMNNSGQSISEAMNFYKIPIEKVIVIYDDISLEPSHIRIRRKGSHGGHNGIKSIIELCGSQDFPRIKIGVGKKPNPEYDLADWVLSKFSDGDLKKLNCALKNSYEALKLILDNKIDEAMNKFN